MHAPILTHRPWGGWPMTAAVLVVVAIGLIASTGLLGSPAAVGTVADTKSSEVTPVAAAQQTRSLDRAVARWRGATTLAAARDAADDARDLISGPHVRFVGDPAYDPTPVRIGLLPGSDRGAGLASSLKGACVGEYVLGGSWRDPAARWRDVGTRIAQYAPGMNTVAPLRSHAQRIVAWATLSEHASTLAGSESFAVKAVRDLAAVDQALGTAPRSGLRCTAAG